MLFIFSNKIKKIFVLIVNYLKKYILKILDSFLFFKNYFYFIN